MLHLQTPESAGESEKKAKETTLDDPLKKMEANFAAFTEQFNLANGKMLNSFTTILSQLEGIATQYNKAMGGSDIYGERTKQNLIEARNAGEDFGFTLKDNVDLQRKISENEKTNFLLQGDQYAQSLVQAELTKGMNETAAAAAAKNFETFKSLGYTVNGTIEGVKQVIDTSLAVGVSTNAIFSQISTNVKQLNLFNFENGVQGMSKMATEAIMVKANMADTLKIANNLFDPQKAVDMAAGLQRMGVQITGLLDPISLMNMGENDPEALQANLIELSKQYVEFDEKQKRFKIMPGAQRQVREIAQTLGMSTEEFAKMGINALDLDRKLSQIKFPDASEFANDDTRKFIANMAQFNEKTGKYEIEVYDEKLGQNVKRAVDSLKPADLEMMKESQKSAQKTTEELLVQANRYLETAANALQKGTAAIPFGAATSRFAQEKLKVVGGTAVPGIQALNDVLFGEEGTAGVTKKFDMLSTTLDRLILSLVKGESSFSEVGGELGGMLSEGIKNKLGDITNFGEIYKNYQTQAYQRNPNLESQFQLTPEMLSGIGDFFKQIAQAIPVQDSLINPDGGLMITGPKGSYFTDKDDKILTSPNIPSGNPTGGGETSSNSKVTAEGKVEIEHKFTGVEGWFKDYMLSQGFLADFVPTLEKFLTKTEG
jgi:hypothetical protein